MNLKTLLLCAAALLALCYVVAHRHQGALPVMAGVTAAGVPQQVDLRHGAALQQGDVTLATQAHFALTARVLSRKDYSWGADADLVPMDLALGWGRMANTDVLADIDISQSGRFYFWRAKTLPIPQREIEQSSANMHMIPANGDIKAQLENVREGQLIHIEGFLVNASRADGWHWNTSMTRNDTGGGACELVYVEKVSAVAP